MYLESLNEISEEVMDSGCRDGIPSSQVLKGISKEYKQSTRQHSEEMLSLQRMFDAKKGISDEVLQQVTSRPKGVFLWSKRSIEIFHNRCH